MKKIFNNLQFSRNLAVSVCRFFAIFLFLIPHTASALTQEIDDGMGWLLANQNASGGWGDPSITEFRDTTVVANVLKKLRESGAEYSNAIGFINSFSPSTNDYLARKTSVLAQDGSDISALINELLVAQNPKERGNHSTYPNYPEGGWGAATGYATNNLDTALAINAFTTTGLEGGTYSFEVGYVAGGPDTINLLAVSDTIITSGATYEYQFDLPDDATSFSVFITGLSGVIDFRIKPGSPPTQFDPFYHLTDGAPYNLNVDSVPLVPGTTYYIRIDASTNNSPINYLTSAQNADGGWGISKGSDSNIYLTSRVLIALEEYAAYIGLGANIADGIAWLKSQQNPDGGFGAGASSSYETALAYIAMANMDLSSTEAQDALNYILNDQQGDGSWNTEAYDTAVSLWAIYTSISEDDRDGDGEPDITDNCPDDSNPLQTDTDGDNIGDVCDDDDDNDGLPDIFETNETGTDPLAVDSDGDGISDGDEDMDFDGMTNLEELNWGTNPKTPDISFAAGLNLFGYPVEVPAGYMSYDLIADLGDETEVDKIQKYDPAIKKYLTTIFSGGVPSGAQFDIISGEGYIVYMKVEKDVSFSGQIICPNISLVPELNFVAIPCMPPGYTSHDLLPYLGPPEDVASIMGFNREIGIFETTNFYNTQPSGPEFRIVNGEGYFINMRVANIITPPLSAPMVVITSHSDGETVSSSPIDVSGTISDSSSTITVNGVAAIVGAGTFTATGVPLAGGPNTITATAVSANNLISSHSITVTFEEGVDYEINKGGTVNDSRNFQANSTILSQTAFYTENQIGIPSFITYSTTGVSLFFSADVQIDFSIQVSSTAPIGIYEFQVEYGLLDSGGNPLTPLTNNVFSFKIKVIP